MSSYGNPSTIWGQLTSPASPVGSMPFVYTDGQSLIVNPAALWWNQLANQLNLTLNNSDQTGTDTINTYLQVDSYYPQSQIIGNIASSTTPGFTASSARGTGPVPSASLVSDFIGQFSGWGYVAPSWVPVAGMYVFVSGTGTAGNLGGELHFATKADAGVNTDRITLDNLGALFATTVVINVPPLVSTASARLGKKNQGWGALSLLYALASAPGAVTINAPAGIVQIGVGTKSVVVTNSLCTVNSVVLAMLQTVDATLTQLLTVVPNAGFFTITGNVNATGACKIGFLLVGTDS